MKKNFLLYLLICVFNNAALAQPGRLDSSFGIKGRITADLSPKTAFSSTATKVLTDVSGNIYTVFFTNKISHIIKKLPNGATDVGYGFSGYSSPVCIVNPTAAIQPDGKIIIAGTTPKVPVEFEDDLHTDFILARFNIDGLIDESFGRHGIVTTDFNGLDDAATSICLQQNGRIIVGGIGTSFVNYGGNSNVYNMVMAKYNSDGSLDKTFNSTGLVWAPNNYLTLTDFSTVVMPQTDGKIIGTRSTDEYGLVMIRFNNDGRIDNSFTLNTKLQTPDSTFIAKAVVIQTDGKIVIGGYWNWALSTDFSLYRFTANGSGDITFGKQGHVTTDFRGYPDFLNSLALQSDNKIVAIGSASNGSNNAFAIARYNANGSPDNTFDVDGKRMTFIGSFNVYPLSLALLSNNKIIAAGYNEPPSGNNIVLAKYNIDGSFDHTFHGNGTITENFKQGSTVYTSTIEQPDGKVIAAGYLFNGNDYDFLVSRFNTNGSFDNTFSGDGSQTISFLNSNDYAFALAIQQDGKIIVSGQAIIGENADFALARLNVDGTIDNTFDGDGKQTTNISTNDIGSHLAIQTDGKILLGANTTLLRYSAAGALDPTFNGAGKLTSIIPINDFALQSTGKIIIGGNRGSNFALARYNSNGTIDNTFSQDGLVQTNLYPDIEYDGYNFYFGTGKSVAIQKDDKIVLAGEAGRIERYGTAVNIGITRYDKDGNIDNSFSDDGIQFIDYSVY
ncbi:MAG: delta-60 repeat domain-containing protein, partial [Ginsengibacter sp.]